MLRKSVPAKPRGPLDPKPNEVLEGEGLPARMLNLIARVYSVLCTD